MASRGIDISGLQQAIIGLNSAVSSLETQISKANKKTNLIKQTFGDTKSLKAFAAALEGIDTKAANAFRSLGSGLKSVAQAAKVMNEIGSLNSAIINIEQLKILVAAVNELSNMAKVGNLDGLKQLANIMTEVKNFTSKISLSEAEVLKINSVIFEISKVYHQLGLFFQLITSNQSMMQSTDSVYAFGAALRQFLPEIISSINHLSSMKLTVTADEIDKFYQAINKMHHALTQISQMSAINTSRMQAVADSFVIAIEEFKLVKPMGGVLTKTINSIASAVRAVTQVAKMDLDVIELSNRMDAMSTVFRRFTASLFKTGIEADAIKPLDKQLTATINSVTKIVYGFIRLLSFKVPGDADASIDEFAGYARKLVTSINVLDAMDEKKIVSINSVSRFLSAVVKNIATNAPGLRSQGSNLASFLKEIATAVDFAKDNVAGIRAVGMFVRATSSLFGGDTFKNMQDPKTVGRYIGSIVGFIKQIGKVAKGSSIDVEALKGIILYIRSVIRLFSSEEFLRAGSNNQIVDFANAIATFISAVGSFSKAYSGTNFEAARATSAYIKAIVGMFDKDVVKKMEQTDVDKVSYFFKQVSLALFNVSKIASTTVDMSSLSKLVNSMTKVKTVVSSIANLGADLSGRNATKQDLKKQPFTVGGGIMNMLISKLNVADDAKGGVKKFISDRLKSARVWAGNMKAVRDYFAFVGEIAKELSKVTTKIQSVGDIGAIDKLTKAIASISRVLPQIMDYSTKLPEGSAIGNFFGRITNLKVGRFKNLKIFFDFIRFTAQSLQGIAKPLAKAGDLSSIGKISESIKSVANALPRVMEFGKTLPSGGVFVADSKRFEGVAKVFELMGYIVKSLSKFPKSSVKVSRVLDDLDKITKIVSDFQGIDFEVRNNAKGFVEYSNSMVGAFNNFNKAKINPAQIKAVVQSVDNLREANGRAQSSIRLTEDASDSAQPKIRSLMQTFGNRVSALADTAKNFNDIRTALSAVYTAVVNIINPMRNFNSMLIGAFDEAAKRMRSFADGAINLGRDLMQNFGLGKFFQNQGLNIAIEFDKISSKLKAAGFSDEDVKGAQEFADVIGINYPLSANQALQAILDLKRAGQNLPRIELTLPSAADLAALTENNDLKLATSGLIAAASGFKRFTQDVKGGYENIAVAADIMAAAADSSTASVESLIEANANVGPAADQMNMTFEEVNAALAVLDERMLKGAEGGTALRAVLSQLVRPQSLEEFERLGISITNQDGSFRSLDAIFKDLKKRYAELGFSQSQITQSMSKMFDTYARTGATILLVNNGYSDMISTMRQSDSAAVKSRQTMDNLAGDIEMLRGSMDTLLKDAFYPSLINRVFRPLAKAATEFVNAILMLPQSAKDTAANAIILTSALITLGGAILVTVGALSKIGSIALSAGSTFLWVQANVLAFASSVGAVVGTVLIAIPVILAIGAAIVSVARFVTSFYEAIENNIGGAGDALTRLKESISGLFNEVRRVSQFGVGAFKELFGPLLQLGQKRFGLSVAGFFDRVRARVEGLRASLAAIDFKSVYSALKEFQPLISSSITDLQMVGKNLIDGFFGGDSNAVNRAKRNISNLFRNVFVAAQRFTGVDFTAEILAFDSGTLSNGLRVVARRIMTGIRNLIVDNEAVIRAGTDFLVNFFSPFAKIETLLRLAGLNKVADVFAAITDRVAASVRTILDIFFALMRGQDPLEVIDETMGSIISTVGRFISEVGRAFGLIRDIVSTIANAIMPPLDGVSGMIESIDLTGIIDSLLRLITDGLGWFNDNILLPIRDNLPAIITFLTALKTGFELATGPITDFASMIGDTLNSALRDLSGLLSGEISFQDWIANLISGLQDAFNRLPYFISQTFFNLGQVLNSDFLRQVGIAIASGDWSQIIAMALTKIQELVSNIGSILPKALAWLGGVFNDRLLINLSMALTRGDIGRVARILGQRLLDLLRNSVNLALRGIDKILDLFGNRTVGAIVLSISAALIGFGPWLAPIIVAQLTSLFTMVSGIITPIISAVGAKIGSFFGTSIAAGITGGPLLLAALGVGAAIAGILYVAANDPDIKASGAVAAENVAQGYKLTLTRAADDMKSSTSKFFADAVDGLYNQAIRVRVGQAFAGLDIGIMGMLKHAFDVSAHTGVINQYGNAIGQSIRQAVQDWLNQFNLGALGSSIGEIMSLPVDLIANLIGAIGAAYRRIAEYVSQIYAFGKSVVNFFVNVFGIVARFVGLVGDGLAAVLNVGKDVGLAIASITAAFFALKAAATFLPGLVAQIGIFSAQASATATTVSTVATGVSAVGTATATVVTQGSLLGAMIGKLGILFGAVFGKAKLLFGGITGTRLFGALKMFGAVLIVLEGLKAAFAGIRAAVDTGDVGVGLLRFLKELSTGLLRLIGLSDFADQIAVTFDQLEYILVAWFDEVERKWSYVAASISRGFSDLDARLRLMVNSGDVFAQNWFKIGDAISGAATLSGTEFTLALKNAFKGSAAELDQLSTQLYADGQLVIDKLAQGINEAKNSGKLDLMPNILPVAERTGMLPQLIDQFRGDAEVMQRLFSDAIFQSQQDTQFGQKYFGQIFAAYVESAKDAKGQIGENQTRELEALLAQFVELGIISADEAGELGKLFLSEFDAATLAAGGLEERFKTLNTAISDLWATTKAADLADLTQQFNEGSISAEEYANKLGEFAADLPTKIAEIRDAQLRDLAEMYKAGEITQSVYDQRAAKIIDEARKLTLDELNAIMSDISNLSGEGVSLDKITEALLTVQEKMKEIGDIPPEIQQRLDNYFIRLASGALKGAAAAEEYNKIMEDLAASQTRLDGVSPLELVTVDDGTTGGGTGKPAEPLLTEEQLAAIEDIDEKSREFYEDEKKRRREDERDEQKARERIDEIRRKNQEEAAEDLYQFQLESQRALQDHEREMLKTNLEAADQLEEAIAGRDEAAALSAMKSRDKELADQKDQYELERQRREQDFAHQQETNARKREEEIRNAQQELVDLIIKHEEERKERLLEHDKEIKELIAKNNLTDYYNRRAAQAEVDATRQKVEAVANFNRQMVSDSIRSTSKVAADVAGMFAGIMTGSSNTATAVNTMVTNIGNALANLVAGIPNVTVRQAGSGNSSGSSGDRQIVATRRFGGTIMPGKPYELAEPDVGAEIYQMNGRRFLISAERGLVKPPAEYSRRTDAAFAGAGGQQINLSLDFSGMVIQGGDNNPQEIANMVEQQVVRKVTDVVRKIRSDRSRM